MFANAVNGLLAAFAIGLLILVHEVGHFLAAKALGVRVEIFSIGFWKKLIGFKVGSTEYRLSLVPLGGYIRMAGELTGEDTGAPDELLSRSPGVRATIFVAGVVMNMMLALVGFMLAFAIGVPFSVAEIGMVEKGWPAWGAGLREGDRIVEIEGVKDPDFHDVMQAVALGGRDTAALTVMRGDEPMSFNLPVNYDKERGIKRLGFQPPLQLIVTALFEIGGKGSGCPAAKAGIKVGDRIVAVNGRPVDTVLELSELMAGYPPGLVRVRVQRDERELTFEVLTERMPHYAIGISSVSTQIKSLQGGGFGQRVGLKAGDRIASVNGRQVKSVVEVEREIERTFGTVEMVVERDGQQLTVTAEVPDMHTLDEFLFSVDCTAGNELAWVEEGSPAWQAGMRPGDTVIELADMKVENWDDIMVAGARAGDEPRMVKWCRGDRVLSAVVSPVDEPVEPGSSLGCMFYRPKQVIRHYGVWRSVKAGVAKTYGTLAEIVLSIRGMARREVSSKNLGSIIVIAQSSYLAAQEGIGKLLYLTAVISAALAFLNILPIPILDGGHLLFVAIEKVRGRPVSEKVMAISQYVGLTLLLALVFYAIANDIMRFIG